MSASATTVQNTSTDQPQADKKVKLLKPSELPIYDVEWHCTHHQTHLRKERSSLEKGIGQIRLACGETLQSLKSSQDRLIEIYETGKAHTLDAIAHLREESNVLSRVGVITVGGLSGLLLGVRGGFFKKLLYGSVGASAVASVCYPEEASQISRSTFTIAKYYALVGYNKVREEINARQEVKSQSSLRQKQDAQKLDKLGEQRPPLSSKPPVGNTVETSNNFTPLPTVKFQGDYGQSHPEDNDMYTTRG